MSEKEQQPIQLPTEIQQQISVLNARIQSFNLATNDLLKEMDNTLKVLAVMTIAMQKENAELKTKQRDKA
jgi:hypothetical protein